MVVMVPVVSVTFPPPSIGLDAITKHHSINNVAIEELDGMHHLRDLVDLNAITDSLIFFLLSEPRLKYPSESVLLMKLNLVKMQFVFEE